MLELGLELAVFLAKSIIIVMSVLIITSFMVSLALRDKDSKDGFELKNLSEQMRKTNLKLKSKILNKKDYKAFLKEEKKKTSKKDQSRRPKVFVLDFKGDIKASDSENLGLCVTQCLKLLDPKNKDEVVLRLESPGGMVSGYGLAASEISRFRDQGLKITVCVDKVAASGGYLMSCVANKIVVAPFAILGSIGVVAGMPNFNKLLKKNDIDYEILTAGKFKRTLTVLGENTPEGRKKFLEQLEQIHHLFKNFVSRYRPQLNIKEVSTGEYWFGEETIKLNLADKIQTSEDYLTDLAKQKDLYLLEHKQKKKWSDKLAEAAKAKLFRFNDPTEFI